MAIVAIARESRITMAADTGGMGQLAQEGAPTVLFEQSAPKIFQPLPGVLVGGFSTVGAGFFQDLHEMEWPALESPTIHWLRGAVIPAFFAHQKTNDRELRHPQAGYRVAPNLIVGTAEGLFLVSIEGGVEPSAEAWNVIGRGALVAEGFLSGTHIAGLFHTMPPADLCRIALAAAARCTVGVAHGVQVVEMDGDGELAQPQRRALFAPWVRGEATVNGNASRRGLVAATNGG